MSKSPSNVQSPPPVMEVRGLSVTASTAAGDRTILSDIDLTVAPRSVLGIIGESGSGKTVLSRALVNWIKPPLRIASGVVNYGGRDLLTLPAEQMAGLRGREIAYIGANPTSALDPTVPVGHQILEKLRAVAPRLSRQEARQRVIDTLEAVRIPSPAQRFDEYPFQFSGGMMQRALIVDALVSNPKLLIADNITQPLDVTVAAQILRLLRELQKDFDTAVVFVSSSLGIVSDIADDMIVLDRGHIVERQSVSNIISRPEHGYTRELIAKVPKIWATKEKPPAPSSGEVVLDVREVEKIYRVRDRNAVFAERKVRAVRGVSFTVRRGENFGIIGESGCGKSTLSRLLSCLEAPETGQILFEGTDIATLRGKELLGLRRRFQLLLQDPYNAIAAHSSIGRTISEPLLIHGLGNRREIEKKVKDVMTEVGLSPALYNQLPVGLSAGQRQRVNIARALVLEPELLILDETLSSLDQVEQAKLLDLFETLQVKRGITYVYISHDLAMVRRVCARIAVMYLGRIVELADNDTMFGRSAHPYTRALLSAVPTVEEKPYRTETYLLEGEPPDPIDIPPGCSFRSRCPFAFDRCATEDPVQAIHESGNASACHLGLNGLPVVDVARLAAAAPGAHP
ncbi:ABC transporter ATP-binding protein [Mesorhizobium sp. INR15]|uniref:dipeptide ABC transporter ATP-binding protein n=1 Tax=Mesorhizobium sp. INR15 TaxID=2654248 RepID=UPI0018967382|nr:ABC transporter ATP-binding protein [Mesorhizobium sp. INR15]QPC94511.1 dipeptide ABC transporter ATP-binding protein [Mesorhizobium sp. INR15]